jgi:Ca-activated chloride channel family protein
MWLFVMRFTFFDYYNAKSSSNRARHITALAVILVGLLGINRPAWAQKPQRLMPERTRVLFVLDGSGSMLAKWDNDLRINIAKDKLIALVDSLKFNKNIEFALRVYGHQFDSKQKNCKDSKLEVGFAVGNQLAIKTALNRIKPQGTTPIAYSLEQATKDFPDDKNYRNVIIMITDGIESCQGDPCAISLGLQKNGIVLRPFIVGLGVGKDFTSAFSCIGKAYDARSGEDFRAILASVARQILGRTTVTVELTDEAGKPLEKDVNLSFSNNITRDPVYDLIHWRDGKGKTDTLLIDPVLTYDLAVGTIPPVTKTAIALEGGRHNTIRLKAPQGTLRFNIKTPKEYGNLKAIVRKPGEAETLHVQDVTALEKYLAGSYEVEVLTFPRVKFKNVNIRQGQTTDLAVDQPGVLNITHHFDGIASVYALEPGGGQTWVENLTLAGKAANIPLQPGQYKLVFRAHEAKGTNYTVVKKFIIGSGQAVGVDILK